MKNNVIEVPKDIRYLTQWSDFKFSNFPAKCIINKQLPGCGMTEYCIRGQEFVILASPRIMLINNKADQHSDVFLVVNEMDKDPGVDKDLNKTPKISNSRDNKINNEELEFLNSRAFEKIKTELKQYITYCFNSHLSLKILVTYDSYHIVKDLLSSPEFGNIFHLFYTVIDEFQSILHDARFKSDTEMQFMNNLKSSHSALFVSATPMLKEYMEMLDDFKDLPYYELDWGKLNPSRIIKPDLDILLMRSVGEMACKVIRTYLDGDFESIIVQRNGIPTKIISTEAVLYVNSVNHITSIINRMELNPDQVLILCSNTEENKRKIKNRLGKDFEIGHVPNPNKGEKFPMFTFCTRTVYLGADFYSKCARSFIFSDANIDSLAVDISEDLPQILGRQRLDENPWKNAATFYYRTTANYRNMNKEDFDKIIERKKKKTINLLDVFKDVKTNSQKYDLADAYQKLAKSYNYKDDYVAVNVIHNGKDTILKPVWNNLVLVNEIRAFRIQQIDYRDRFSVFSKATENSISINNDISEEVKQFFSIYESYTTMYDKLKLLCECEFEHDTMEIILAQIPDSDEVKSYYLTLGSKRLKELSYRSTKIKKELGIVMFNPLVLENEIYFAFKEGDKYSLSSIKNMLTNIYNVISYKKTPKATDLEDYFEVKKCKIPISDGKRENGYELIKRLH